MKTMIRRVSVAFLFFFIIVLTPGMVGAQVSLQVESGVVSHLDETAEVAVSLDYAGEAPSIVIVCIAFANTRLSVNSEYYEVIAREADGDPVYDSEGDLVVTRSAVMADDAVTAAGKQVDAVFHETMEDDASQGYVAVAVTGLNNTALPKGRLFTMALRVLANNGSADTINLRGLDTAHPGGQSYLIASSASASDGSDLAVTVGNGSIVLGCERPSAPAGVTATADRKDGVLVAWTVEAGMEYRVYRSADGNTSTVISLGTGWSTEGSFLDESAAAPTTVKEPGCFRAGEYAAVKQIYWVKGRRVADHCESVLSDPGVEGARTVSKKVLINGKAAKSSGVSSVALYLDGVSQENRGFVIPQMSVTGKSVEYTGESRWVPADDSGERGWIVFYPDAAWTPGDELSLSARLVTEEGVVAAESTGTVVIDGMGAPVVMQAGISASMIIYLFVIGFLIVVRRFLIVAE